MSLAKFADDFASWTTGSIIDTTNFLSPLPINDWPSPSDAKWKGDALGATISAAGLLNKAVKFNAGGGIHHQTFGYYNDFSLYFVVNTPIDVQYGAEIDIANKDANPLVSAQVNLFKISVMPDGTVSALTNGNVVKGNSGAAGPNPPEYTPKGVWILVQINVQLFTVGIGGNVFANVDCSINARSSFTSSFDTGIPVGSTITGDATANLFTFFFNNQFLDNISFYNPRNTLTDWPDYPYSPTGLQNAVMTQGVMDLLKAVESNASVTQGAVELFKSPVDHALVTQGVIELISNRIPPTSGGWKVYEA